MTTGQWIYAVVGGLVGFYLMAYLVAYFCKKAGKPIQESYTIYDDARYLRPIGHRKYTPSLGEAAFSICTSVFAAAALLAIAGGIVYGLVKAIEGAW